MPLCVSGKVCRLEAFLAQQSQHWYVVHYKAQEEFHTSGLNRRVQKQFHESIIQVFFVLVSKSVSVSCKNDCAGLKSAMCDSIICHRKPRIYENKTCHQDQVCVKTILGS